MAPGRSKPSSDHMRDQTFALTTLLTRSLRTGRASTKLSANNRHWTCKSARPHRQSAHPKYWQRYDTSPIVDPMFRAGTWCAAGRVATPRRSPLCPDRSDRARVSIPPVFQAPCATRGANWAPFLGDGNSQRRYTSRSRLLLLHFGTSLEECGYHRRGGIKRNCHRLLEPGFDRGKKEQSGKPRVASRWSCPPL